MTWRQAVGEQLQAGVEQFLGCVCWFVKRQGPRDRRKIGETYLDVNRSASQIVVP